MNNDNSNLGYIIFIIILCLPYFVNGYKLTQCDFESPYRCEGLHAVGLVGPLAYITVWFDTDE